MLEEALLLEVPERCWRYDEKRVVEVVVALDPVGVLREVVVGRVVGRVVAALVAWVAFVFERLLLQAQFVFVALLLAQCLLWVLKGNH